MVRMLRSYALVRPIVGFWQDTRVLVQIPSGALLELLVRGELVGLCDALWGKRPLFVFREDVDRNGVALEIR